MPKVKGSGSVINASFDGLATKKNSNEKNNVIADTADEKSVLILISITGNKFCEGEYLASIIKDAVDKFRHKVSILLVDELQKYNLQAKYPEADAGALEEKQKQLITTWWDNNENSLFSIFKIKSEDREHLKSITDPDIKIEKFNLLAELYGDTNCRIFNWKAWIKHLPNYLEDEKIYADSFENGALADNLQKSALDYAKRKIKYENEVHEKTNNNNNSEKKYDEKYFNRLVVCSKAFVKAETLGAIKGALDMGYDYIAYPGDALAVFSAFYSTIMKNYCDINNEPRKFEYIWLHINFRKKEPKLKNTTMSSSDESGESLPKTNVMSPNTSPTISPSKSPIDEVMFLISEKIIRPNHVNSKELQELMITYKNLKNLQLEQSENNGFTLAEPMKNENTGDAKISPNDYGRFYSAVPRADLPNSKPVNISSNNVSKPAKPLSKKNRHSSVSSPDVVINISYKM